MSSTLHPHDTRQPRQRGCSTPDSTGPSHRLRLHVCRPDQPLKSQTSRPVEAARGDVPSTSPRNSQSVRTCLEPDQVLRERARSYGTGPEGDLAPGPGRLSHHCLPSSALVAAHRLSPRPSRSIPFHPLATSLLTPMPGTVYTLSPALTTPHLWLLFQHV